MEINKLAAAARAVNHPLRQKIINFLSENTEACVTDIMVHVRKEQSEISQHLKIMRDADIVTFRKEGKKRLYFVNYNVLNTLKEANDSL